MVIALFVPYGFFDSGGVEIHTSIIDGEDLDRFYEGLAILVASIGAAVIPFVLRSNVLLGSVLITIGTLAFFSFLPYVVDPLRGDDAVYLRPGGIIGLGGALIVVAAGVFALLAARSDVSAPVPATRSMSPMQPPQGWYPDPAGIATERYWNGAAWSNEVR
jgi:hypothetical protein